MLKPCRPDHIVITPATFPLTDWHHANQKETPSERKCCARSISHASWFLSEKKYKNIKLLFITTPSAVNAYKYMQRMLYNDKIIFPLASRTRKKQQNRGKNYRIMGTTDILYVSMVFGIIFALDTIGQRCCCTESTRRFFAGSCRSDDIRWMVRRKLSRRINEFRAGFALPRYAGTVLSVNMMEYRDIERYDCYRVFS